MRHNRSSLSLIASDSLCPLDTATLPIGIFILGYENILRVNCKIILSQLLLNASDLFLFAVSLVES